MHINPIRLVIDANILISAFLKAATTRRLVLDERLELYAPVDLVLETQKVLKKRLAKRWQASPDFDFDQLFSVLTQGIHHLEPAQYNDYLPKALEIAPHAEDAPYLAVALSHSVSLWSNDAGMKDQDLVRVFTTEELLQEIRK